MIDDGELGQIRQALGERDIDYTNLRGIVNPEDLEGEFDLIVATVKRLLPLERSVDLAALDGKPTVIAVHGQDFLPLRVRLRRMGVHFLVHSHVGPEALELLLVYALYGGSEKRRGPRLPVGSAVTFAENDGEPLRAELLDLSHGGCRLLMSRAIEPGASLTVELPSKLAGGQQLTLTGVVARSNDHEDDPNKRLVTMIFEGLGADAQKLLDGILQGRVIGTLVSRLGDELAAEKRPTVPAATGHGRDAGRAVGPSNAAADPRRPPGVQQTRQQRRNRRIDYDRPVTALLPDSELVILGTDLSVEGMRSEPLPQLKVGVTLELAIYGVSRSEPVLVQARVARNDEVLGTVFHFTRISPGERTRLEAIVASGAEIASLSENERGAHVVLTRARRRDR